MTRVQPNKTECSCGYVSFEHTRGALGDGVTDALLVTSQEIYDQAFAHFAEHGLEQGTLYTVRVRLDVQTDESVKCGLYRTKSDRLVDIASAAGVAFVVGFTLTVLAYNLGILVPSLR